MENLYYGSFRERFNLHSAKIKAYQTAEKDLSKQDLKSNLKSNIVYKLKKKTPSISHYTINQIDYEGEGQAFNLEDFVIDGNWLGEGDLD
jgi:hypothetical protein